MLARAAFDEESYNRKNFEVEIGSFLNIGNDQFEVDGYLEFQTRYGLFSDIWLDQIDLNQDTDVQSFASIGYMKSFDENFVLGFGYAKSRSQDNIFLDEVFIGGTSGSFSGGVYNDLENNNKSFLWNLDVSSMLNYKLFDISIDGIFYNSNLDLFFRVSKVDKSNFSYGFILSREIYEATETKTKEKNGIVYTKEIPIQKKGLFYSIFIGFAF